MGLYHSKLLVLSLSDSSVIAMRILVMNALLCVSFTEAFELLV